MRSFEPTARHLATLVARSLVGDPPVEQDANAVPLSYTTARVQQALRQLAQQLGRAAVLANELVSTDDD